MEYISYNYTATHSVRTTSPSNDVLIKKKSFISDGVQSSDFRFEKEWMHFDDTKNSWNSSKNIP